MDFLQLMRLLMEVSEKCEGKMWNHIEPGRLVITIPISLEVENMFEQGKELFAEVGA